ncbi:cullin, putative [Trypanosoma brucei gambiense DAL972]|uniref:Cullin, putative n=2 Tax=Trypanosoma brucei TaxID=5691 RepID=C9ZW70_TRYB9|nr:cullin, putative [Trypanosoma brucei gambiense DAL972]RHW73364.1 cullin [Trypanosoma brucei equiperdum]CBH13659.1 cullin, putative [Trypanosoma brucei gambiense DAL972]|eukprot:XP_011775935.1 cullin, putative [Trypanosoma brucei gambiense DAL972]
MLEEDLEAIRRMKADFEAIGELTDNEFRSDTTISKRMNHYSTVYNAATRITGYDDPRDPMGSGAEELLYVDFQEMLTRYLLKHSNLSAPSEMELFARILKVWERYKVMMKWNVNAFAYLSRFYIVNFSKPPLRQVALRIFHEQVLKKYVPTVVRVTHELLTAERKGEGVNREDVREAIELLSSVTVEQRQEIYNEQFLKQYLELTKDYYVALVAEWGESSSHTELLRQIEGAYNDEDVRCSYYFPPEDKRAVMVQVEEVLLDSSVVLDKLLKSKDGFIAKLKSREKNLLKLYYNLLSRRQKALACLADLTRDGITAEGSEKLRQYDNKERDIDFKSCVVDIMKLQDEFLTLSSECFDGDTTMLKAVKEGIERVYADGVRLTETVKRFVPMSELLAHYADSIIQGSGCSSSQEEELDRVITALSYVTDRDTFLAHSRDLLAQRILSPKKKFDDNIERSFAHRISHCCGVSSTCYLEGMLHDVDVAEGFRAADKLEAMGVKLPFAFDALVLKKGIWPPRIHSENFTPPPIISEALHSFEAAYLQGTRGRVLTWSYSNSSGDVHAAFKKGPKTLVMPGLQCWVLLAFNGANQLTVDDVVGRFGMTFDDAKPVLLSLVKASILIRESNFPTVSLHDIFIVNDNFTSKLKKMKIAMGRDQNIVAAQSEEVAREVEEDRKPAIDACLVRIMKSRRVLEHSMLVEECKERLLPTFSADPKLVKQRIEELIRKEFIERDANTPGLYRYAA